MDFDEVAPVLQAVGMAAAREEPIDMLVKVGATSADGI
jgi:hypothetical protein